MKKIKVLLLCPYAKNRQGRAGGIGSWARKFIATFPDEEFELLPVNLAPELFFVNFKRWDREKQGIKTMLRLYRDIKATFREHPDIRLMHTTTSGGMGCVRDYMALKMCKRHGVGCIMHCRFGTIMEFYEKKNLFSWLFRKNMQLYDQVWVLDRRSEAFLNSQPKLKNKIFLTPNSIDVPTEITILPKSYKKIGFVGNLFETKGVLDLTKAVSTMNNDVELFIAGTGSEDVKERIKTIAGKNLGNRIKLLGILPNDEAVRLIEQLDIIALPTYYKGEAFPISILEAMSRGKLVISCHRAAIPDMLTALDGTTCGVLVPERSPEALFEAIMWCQTHKKKADEMCKKAYEKVWQCYRKEVVYDIYRLNYRKLLQS